MTIPWDPIIQDRLARLHLLSREIVWGMNSGQHRSNRVTRSVEFVEHKMYQPGDPISSLDWKVFARTDKLMIRRQSADTDANIVLVLDASGDMQSTSSGTIDEWTESKFGKSLTAMAGLTQMAAKRGDPVGLWICGGSDTTVGLSGYIPPSQRSLHPIFHRLASVNPEGNANLGDNLRQLGMRLPRKSIVIVVSDWMEDPEEWGPQLEILASMGHDIRCIQLYSEREWALDLPDSVQVFSHEMSSENPLDTIAMQSKWSTVLEEYKQQVSHWAARSNSIWIPAALEQELLPPLIQLIKGRG